MAASPKTWTDNSSPSCNASDLNGFNLEINNLISSANISLDYNNHNQTAQAVARYAGDGDYYVDSGTANAYVLSAQSPKQSPVAYTEGQLVRFIAQNDNTGPSTLNLSSLGLKDIIYPDGDPLIGGEIPANRQTIVYYNGIDFILMNNAAVVVTPDQFQNSTQIYSADTGTTGALVATPSPPYEPYQAGTRIFVKAANTNGGVTTLNVSGRGAVEVKQIETGGLVSLAGNEIQANGIYEFVYNGSVWQIMNPSQNNSGVPVGTILPNGGITVDAGYLAWDGQLVSRTTYSALFAKIGVNWGAGDGVNTFQVGPSNPKRALVGAGGSSTPELGNTVGSLGGTETETITEDQMPSHTHAPFDTDYFLGLDSGTNKMSTSSGGPFDIVEHALTETHATGGGQAHNNVQPSMVVLFQVKY